MARAGRGSVFLGDALAVWDAVRSSCPYLEDEVVVTVTGSPKANRRDLYYLACSTAYSIVKRFDALPGVSPPPGVIMIEWDAASNAVVMRLNYRTNLLTAGFIDINKQLGKLALLQGPPEEVVGETWNFTGALALDIGGLGPVGALLGLQPGLREMVGHKPRIPAPGLRFAGRPIITRNPTCAQPDPTKAAGGILPSPNPRPCGDNRTRGTMYELVYAALTTPQGAGLKQFPAVTPGLEFSGG